MRAIIGSGQLASGFTTSLRVKGTWWRMTERGLFRTLPCFGGMRRRSFSVASEVFVAQIRWHDGSRPCTRHCGGASARSSVFWNRIPPLSLCNALHPADETEDQELENLLECALLHAKQAFRGLAGELDRRVRAWIRANSTLGAGALHKWAARDDLAPRLPQQALDSEGLLTPKKMLGHWKAKWSTRWQQHRDRFLQLRLAICKLRHEIRSGFIEQGLVGGIHPETLRAQAQLCKTETGMGADRWRAQDLAKLPLQAFSTLSASWRHVSESWPGRRSGWRFSPLCSP